MWIILIVNSGNEVATANKSSKFLYNHSNSLSSLSVTKLNKSVAGLTPCGNLLYLYFSVGSTIVKRSLYFSGGQSDGSHL